MLLSARWDNNEVDTALMVLKQNTKNQQTHVDTLHKVFQSDDRLTPTEISALLGISVKVDEEEVNNVLKKRLLIEKFRTTIAIALAILFALAGLSYFMYLNGAGPFYDAETAHTHATSSRTIP